MILSNLKKPWSLSKHPLSKRRGAHSGKTDWLVKILGFSGNALPVIREEVYEMMREFYLTGNGRPQQDISYDVSSRLIKRSAMKTGAFGGITAAPAALPGIGTLGTVIIGTTMDLSYLIRTQIELCYAISAAYGTHIDAEELRAVTLSLLGFSGAGQMFKEIAASTLRDMVDETAARYINRGLTHIAGEVAAKVTPRLTGRAYKLLPFIGIPLSASINIASTMMVGNQARKYFSTWEAKEPRFLKYFDWKSG